MKKIICLLLFTALFCLSVSAIEAPSIAGQTSIHAQAPVSLRVKAQMCLEDSRSEKTIEYGFLITREKLLESAGLHNGELTLDCDVYYIKGVSKAENVDEYFAIEDQTLFYTALIRGVAPQYYDDILVVRTYIVTEAETLYGEPAEVSLYGTAKQIKLDLELFNGLTSEHQEVINEIIYTVEGYPEPEPEPEPEPKPETDPQLITMLEKGLGELKKLRITNKNHKKTRDLLVECMGFVLEDAKSGEYVDKDYIYANYDGYLSQVSDLINVQMTDEERSNFLNMLANTRNISKDVQDFLMDYFDFALSDIN